MTEPPREAVPGAAVPGAAMQGLRLATVAGGRCHVTLTLMCRYAGFGQEYRSSYVCLLCRHVAQYRPSELAAPPRCPGCQQDLQHAGRDFAAPRKTDHDGWKAVEQVLAAGLDYDSCGCDGPGPRPATGAQVRQRLRRGERAGLSQAQALSQESALVERERRAGKSGRT